ncbi:hypothetical protein ACQR35_12005 [Pseudarthrobacter sp. J1738]|uniref:hypothetical protein n=1 Tax=Pseudarthrobacter sp. J1738 TaxID=3420446 RepID=UPI003D2DDC06
MNPPIAPLGLVVQGERVDLGVEQHVEGCSWLALDGVGVLLDPDLLEERLVADASE